ncbi:MAG: hypothetical protein IPG96_08795 [Proteobacteria bacterium]|nr:hypothetical protein [Pseudomonadota bacterium]
MMRLRWVCSSTLTALGAVALLSAAGCGNESEEYYSYPPWAPGDQELTGRDGIVRDARPTGARTVARVAPATPTTPARPSHAAPITARSTA